MASMAEQRWVLSVLPLPLGEVWTSQSLDVPSGMSTGSRVRSRTNGDKVPVITPAMRAGAASRLSPREGELATLRPSPRLPVSVFPRLLA